MHVDRAAPESPFQLNNNVDNHDSHVREYQKYAPRPRQEIAVIRHYDERCHQQRYQPYRTYKERCSKMQLVGFRRMGRYVHPGDAYAKEDVQHRPPKTCREAHDGSKDLGNECISFFGRDAGSEHSQLHSYWPPDRPMNCQQQRWSVR